MKAYTQLQKAPEIFDPVTGAVLKALWFRPRFPPGKARRLNWLERLLGHKRIVTHTRSGFRFACDQTDWLQRNLLCNGIHEPEITQLLESELQPSDVFYDIGANSGYFSLLAATMGVGFVIGFEPDPDPGGGQGSEICPGPRVIEPLGIGRRHEKGGAAAHQP